MLEVPEELEDELAAALALGTSGARVGPAGPGRSRLEIFLAAGSDPRPARDRASALLRRAGLDPALCGLRLVQVRKDGWVEAYQASLEPFPLGRRFRVQPGFRRGEDHGRRDPIVLAPGRAFGTGDHPTTRLCVAELERRVSPGSRWLDLGCGTGILAVVAHRCGAAHVLALDRDAEAVEVARGVLRDNRAVPGVCVRRGSVEDAEPGVWDGVVCNISARFMIEHAARLATRLRPAGVLVAAGFLEEDLAGVRRAAVAGGLVEQDRAEASSWVVLVLRRS